MNSLCNGPVLLYEVQLNKGPEYEKPSMNCFESGEKSLFQIVSWFFVRV